MGPKIINWDNKKDLWNESLQKLSKRIAKDIKDATLNNQTSNIGEIKYTYEIWWIICPGKPLLTNPPA